MILVTGSEGFIGSHVMERLGEEAIGFDWLRKEEGKDTWESLTDVNSIALRMAGEDIHTIIHLAALAGVRDSVERPAEYMENNVTGSVRLLEAGRKHGVKKFVLASSSSIYGEVADWELPIGEDQDMRPASPYAASKVAMEAVAHAYHELYDLDITCLRFFTVYGPGQRDSMAIAKFAKQCAAKQPMTMYGDGSSARDYLYVTDAVDAIMAAMGARGYSVYNVGTGKHTRLDRLAAKIAAAMGSHVNIQHLPDQKGDVPITEACTDTIYDELGWQAEVDIDLGLALYAKWLKAQR